MKTLALALTFCVAFALNSSAQITIDSVGVGNLGNANDSTGFGGVGYYYAMSKYEVTLSQYTTFLNSVAKADPRALWNSSMSGNVNIAGIARSGATPNFTYSVMGDGSRPVTFVRWFDAARFANWLHNGQPVGAEGNATTDTGAYALGTATSGNTFTRQPGALYFLPSENEWYKSAYYQPAAQGGDADDYWLYPTRSNAQPNSRNGSAGDPNSANYYYDDGIANGFNGGYAVNNSLVFPAGNALTTAGAFNLATSYYGTFDQGGSVAEWTEGTVGVPYRVFRGGSWANPEGYMAATFHDFGDPTSTRAQVGFRIATIPEPASYVIMALGTALLAMWRRRAV